MSWLAVGLALLAIPAVRPDTVRLEVLQRAAVEHDPRARQFWLQQKAAELRLADLTAERLPALTLEGSATHQSEVPAIPLELPNASIPIPPKDRIEAKVGVQQLIYDSGVLRRRRAVERARLVEESAALRAALYPLHAQVNEAFFGALSQQARLAESATLIADLEARLALVRAQAMAGAALPGDTAAVRAELLRAEQSRGEAAAGLRAARGVLAELTGLPITADDPLALPDLAAKAARMRDAATDRSVTEHPQYAAFAARLESLRRQSELAAAGSGPRLSAFGQWAYGRPGLEQFTDRLHAYWLAGVEVSWRPWDRGTTDRAEELYEVQRSTVASEEEAFRAGLRRAVLDQEATIDRLAGALASDERIIVLREQVERQAQAQLGERAITPAAYVTIRRELQQARLARWNHRVELARAQATYLTTLGTAPW